MPGPGPTDGGGSTAPGPYTETSVDVRDMVGPLAVDVTVPQVAGGDPKIAEIFNSAMRAALDARTAELDSGRLTGADGAVVHIGKKVISGALLVTAEDGEGAVELADTVVVNLDTGTVMTLDDLFPDVGAALQRLQDLSRELGPSTTAAKDFDGNKVTAKQATFSRWLATPDGMRIYFAEGSVAPSSYKLVRLNVPWDELSDVLDPGITEAVRS
ncbi:RsiV family protein [Rhodococcus opacus]|uniref:RsiV family protein n=1 Tax=Rhodococcus opacus TaxID=37919 RepID=UPI000A99D1EB|nr:RsiV family protein [Rhodococcus opacus]